MGIVYIFNDRNEFEKIEFRHLGYKKKYRGIYVINSDTLTLNYKPYTSVHSKYQIISSQSIKEPVGSATKKGAKAFFTKIRVVDEAGQPLVGINLIMMNEKKEVVMGFSSNENGLFPELSINDKYITDMVFSFLGFHDEVIKTKVLYGTITEILLTLHQGIEYSSQKGKEKYLIKVKSLNQIVLTSIIEPEMIILKKKR